MSALRFAWTEFVRPLAILLTLPAAFWMPLLYAIIIRGGH